MADGDTLRSGIPPFFRTVGEQIREGFLSHDELIDNVSEGIKKSAQKFKDEPIKFLKERASHFQQINSPIFSSLIDLADELAQVREKSSHQGCQNDAINLAVASAQEVLFDLDNNVYIEDMEGTLYENYLRNIYKSQCDEPLRKPLDDKTFNLSQEEINSSLDNLEEGVEAHIKKFASQLKQTGTVDKLRMPPSSKSKKDFDLDADLNGSSL